MADLSIDDQVIEYAKTKFNNLDCIADVFTFQIVWLSEQLANKLGYKPDDLKEMSVRKLLHLDPMEFIKIAIAQYSGKKDQKTLINKNGEKVEATGEIHSFVYKNSPYIAVLNVILAA